MSAESVGKSVTRLRSEIETIDRAIVLLLGARTRAQHRLLARKEAAGLPGLDLAQEGKVLARAAGWAREAGTSEQLATEVIRLALDSGKRAYSRARSESAILSVVGSRRGARPTALPVAPRVNSG
jgi:chorismate mutase